MQRRREQISLIKKLALKEAEQALNALQLFAAELARNRQQLETLINYKNSYQINQQQAELTTATLMNFYAFRENLDKAIAQQRQLLEQAEAKREQFHQQWLSKQQRVDLLDKLLAKIEQEEQYLLNIAEQKLLDAFSSRLSLPR